MTAPTPITCILDGEPYRQKVGEPFPFPVRFVGMEQEPNQTPRYGKLHHPWFNKPCYVRTP